MTTIRSRLGAAALCLACGMPGFSQEPAPVSADAGLGGFGKMVPEGFVNRGVRIPSFSDGKLRSLVLADSVTRLDDERLFAEKLLLTFYGAQKGEDIQVNLITAHHYMPDQLLRSTQRSRVSRSDFEVLGDAMVFDAATSVGRMRGNVHTIIVDSNALSGKTAPAEPSRK